MSQSSLLNTEGLPQFFKDRVDDSLRNLHLSISPEVEFYLVNLLLHFTHIEHLYDRDEKGQFVEKALALQFLESCMASSYQKINMLKKLGDVALYISGFFPDTFQRKIVGLDYYIKMGHQAYYSVSQLVSHDPYESFKELFGELAINFMSLVDVLSDVRDTTSIKTDREILRLYEQWLSTGSDRLKKLLEEQGIVPHELVKSKYEQ